MGAGRERQGHVEPHELALHLDGADERAQAQDERDVGDVRADDVTQRHRAQPVEGRTGADDQFGHRRADGDHRQPDEEGRHAQPQRNRRAAAHERFRPRVQQGDPEKKSDEKHRKMELVVIGHVSLVM